MTHRLTGICSGFALACALGLAAAGQAPPEYAGRPAFEENSDRSYYVWHEGATWHVRWTTLGEMRQFGGSVVATGGKIDDLKRIDVEAEARIIRPGRPPRVVRGPAGRPRAVAPGRPPVVDTKLQDHITREDDHTIRWRARTDDIDGFSFKVEGVNQLRFDLRIEGNSRVRSVEIGRGNVHPSANPFTVRLR